MNNLPEDIINKIYRHKHEFEYVNVLNQILLYRNNNNVYTMTKRQLLKELQDNVNDIECIVLSDGSQITVLDYLRWLKNKLFI